MLVIILLLAAAAVGGWMIGYIVGWLEGRRSGRWAGALLTLQTYRQISPDAATDPHLLMMLQVAHKRVEGRE